jgi:MFS family permease
MTQVGTILAGFFMGFIYDLYGRKTPMIIFLLFSSFAMFLFPFVHTEWEFYHVIVFILPLNILMGNPWVPDLICEES